MDQSDQPRRFTHLHLHTEYSLLDGGNRVDRLVARVKELGMDSVAITDHGNMHGAIAFYEACRAADIKPILGVEAYVAPGDRRDRTYTGVGDGGYHLVLLAENNTGWENLLHLCSEAYLTGFYFKPRIDRELLMQRGAGLIAINGHLGSEIGEHLLSYERTKDSGHWDAAVESARWHAECFADEGTGPRFFIEMQRHIPEQNCINPHLIRLSRELNLPLVCDNDAHFLRAEDHDGHDTLICISMGKVKGDESRLRYTPELYVKSPEQMWEQFDTAEFAGDGDDSTAPHPGLEALENTAAIADRCNVELPVGANHAPVVIVKMPAECDLPRHDDPQFGGDLTAWFQAFCSRFELAPATDPGLKQAELAEQCDRALRLLAEAGMVWRYGPEILASRHEIIEGSDEATKRRSDEGEQGDVSGWDKWARLNRELKILSDKLISAYFLIVWDFVNWGRDKGIPALARGSGVGTMVGFTLGLSNACPVYYGLLFERFTDPDRSEYPDIDIDLCQDGRADVIDYVRRKYGHVAQIITFGTLKARAAVRDVARVLELPLSEADKVAKLIPEELGITLDRALEAEPDLKKRYETDDLVRRVIDNARVIEGQARHASVHAAGVIVATRPLSEIVPLYRQSGAADHEIVTQWDGPTCEKLGLLKMDFLGLRTLSVLEEAKRLIRTTLPEEVIWEAVGRKQAFEATKRRSDEATEGGEAAAAHPLDLERLTYTDPNVFELFARGDTTGVFQFESGGMRRLLTEMKPDRLEDLIAANALFRPGPMDLIPDYNRRKHGTEQVPKVHPIVDKFTAETYGVMVYQEQVMQIVHELGDIPLRSAYTLIKAIGKKKAKVIDANRPKFVEGAQKKGLSKAQAEELFELILKFAGYGFNKSHSTGYAIVAYQTAYLKTYFPSHYMAAFLTYESQAQKVSDWIPYLEDCRKTRFRSGKVGVEVLPPDINRSGADFAVVYEEGEPRDPDHGHVRFGLRAIKGAGSSAIAAIIKERDGEAADEAITELAEAEGVAAAVGDRAEPKPYTSLFDFCERVPQGAVNKATIEALIKCGAFDSVHGRDARAAMVASLEHAVSAGQSAARDRAAGQGGLFGGGAVAPPPEPALARIDPWDEQETLRQEKETLGFYVSSHPLQQWSQWISAFATAPITTVQESAQDRRVVLAAVVQSVRTLVVRSGRTAGQKMGILTLEDLTGVMDAVLFADRFALYGHLLESDEPKFFLGKVDHSRGGAQLIIDQVAPINAVPLEKGRLQIIVREPRLNGTAAAAVDQLAAIIGEREVNGAANGPAGAVRGGAEAPPTPIELVVCAGGCAHVLRPESPRRVPLDPPLIQEINDLLGENSARLVGGVAVEIADDRRGRRTG